MPALASGEARLDDGMPSEGERPPALSTGDAGLVAASNDTDCAPSVCGLVGGLVGSCASMLAGDFAGVSFLLPAGERERRIASMAGVSALRVRATGRMWWLTHSGSFEFKLAAERDHMTLPF